MSKQAECLHDEKGINPSYALANLLTNNDACSLQSSFTAVNLINNDKVCNNLFNPELFLPLNYVSVIADWHRLLSIYM